MKDAHPEGVPDPPLRPLQGRTRCAIGSGGIAKRSTPGYYLAALQATLAFFGNVIISMR